MTIATNINMQNMLVTGGPLIRVIATSCIRDDQRYPDDAFGLRVDLGCLDAPEIVPAGAHHSWEGGPDSAPFDCYGQITTSR